MKMLQGHKFNGKIQWGVLIVAVEHGEKKVASPSLMGKTVENGRFHSSIASLPPKPQILVLKKAIIPSAHATKGTSQPLCPGSRKIITDGKQVQGWDFIAKKIIDCTGRRMLLSWDLYRMTRGADGFVQGGTGSWYPIFGTRRLHNAPLPTTFATYCSVFNPHRLSHIQVRMRSFAKLLP